MKHLYIFLSIFLVSSASCFAQQKCGTMEVYNRMLEKDSSLRSKMDSSEIVTQENISKNGLTEDFSNFKPPLIPGYVPTGDPRVDFINWQKAKKDLYSTDPELYIELTRIPNSNNQNR